VPKLTSKWMSSTMQRWLLEEKTMAGPRPHYHKDYYGAFVLDPDGHNVEAVCREPR
jgi:hypothetical protein